MPSSIGIPMAAEPRPAGLVTVDGRTYPLERVRLDGRAEGGLACTTLTQTYTNPYDEPLEVLYTLPLHADGAVLGYAIHFGERVIRGEVMKREAAAKAYEDALFEGRTAGLLEQERDDTFTQRLGALPGRQSARIEIQVLHPLAFVPKVNGGQARWEYRFPTVAGIRYEGAPGRVPDAARLDVDRNAEGAIPTRIEAGLTLADGAPDALAASSHTHDIDCQAAGSSSHITLRAGARLDRDLVVRWNVCAGREGVRLVEGPGLPGDDGRYALLTLVPPLLPVRWLTRDLTLLLDASGSMSGEPLAWAKRVIAELLASLEPEDRFELLAFSNQVTRLTNGPVPGDERNVERALRSLDPLEAGGGTEMGNALVEALKPLREDSQRQVVLITDGDIGFEGEIVSEILRRLPEGARVHALGVGSAPNRTLLQGVARAGRGAEVIVSVESELAEAAGRLRRATARPVLTNVTVQGSALRAAAPARPRDVMAGQPLVLALDLAPEGGTLEVGARQGDAPDTWVWRIDVPMAGAGSAATTVAIGALFGRETIADLELRAAAAAPRSEDRIEADAAIEAAGLRHRIASRLTSLVAIAEEPSVDPLAPRRRERLPVEMPQGVAIEGVGMEMMDRKLIGHLSPSHSMFLASLGSRAMKGRQPGGRWGSPIAKLIPAKPSTPVEPVELSLHGRVLRYEDRFLVIEFEVPVEGLELPAVSVKGKGAAGEPITAAIVPEQSTGSGPFHRGTIVRLALRIPEDHPWPVSSPVTLSYGTRVRGGDGSLATAQVTLRFELPTPSPPPDAR
jgi:Ca-activated chloride channel family protein